MGEALIILGVLLGIVSILVIYGLLCATIINADYWWQKVLCILMIIALPTILIVVGAMIC